MKPTFHYDTMTWFLNWHHETYWKGVDLVQLPTRIVRELQRSGMPAGRLDVIRDKPWLRFRNGLFLPAPHIPVSGGAPDAGVPEQVAWSFAGIEFPYVGAGVDNAALSGTMANQVQQYRDVTLSGTVTSYGGSPGFMFCRTLNLAGQELKSYAPTLGGAGQTANFGQGGYGGLTETQPTGLGYMTNTADIAPSATVPFDALQALMASGGAGGSGLGGNGVAGTGANKANLFAALSLYYVMIGCGGGGAGAGGAGGTSTGTQAAGGRRGMKGADGSTTASGGGGGAGIGGGGGGGNGNTTGGTGGNGGNGSGALIIVCDDVVGTAGTISANGVNGTNASGTNAGGGGGGGGGIALVFARHVSTTPTVTASGGSAGAKAGTGGNGAAGGAGIAQLVRST